MKRRATGSQLRRALESWHKLNNVVLEFREEDVEALIGLELLRDEPRKRFLNRLRGRLDVLRRERERKELGL